MTLLTAPVRLLLGSLAFLGLGSSLFAQSLPQTLSEQDVFTINRLFADSVAVIAGDQVVTDSELGLFMEQRKWKERIREASKLPREEAQKVFTQVSNEATAEYVESVLEVQAGQDRGFNPEIVAAIVERRFKDSLKRRGGYKAFHAHLKRSNSNPERFRESIRNSLYKQSWRGAVTGHQPGSTGRRELNRYVRPGELWGAYHAFMNSPLLAKAELTGFREAKFDVIELAFILEQQKGPEAVMELAQNISKEIASGVAPFEEFHAFYAKDRKSVIDGASLTLTMGQLASEAKASPGGKALMEFLVNAEEGQTSPPIELRAAIHLFKLVKIHPEEPKKPFADFGVQKAIREHLSEQQNRVRLGRAHIKLIWENRILPGNLRKAMVFFTQESFEK